MAYLRSIILFRLFQAFCLFFVLFIFSYCFAFPAGAQEEISPVAVPEVVAPSLRAVISGVDTVEVGKNIILDASASEIVPEGGKVTYIWDLGEGTVIRGQEIVHTYKNPGNYIIKLTVEQDGKKHTTESWIFVYEQVMVLITGFVEDYEKILRVVEDAKKNGTWVKLIDTSDRGPEFSLEEVLTKRLVENQEDLSKASTIIFWPERVLDFNVFSAFYRETMKQAGAERMNYQDTKIVFIGSGALTHITPFAQSAYNLLQPQYILITRKEAINPILLAQKDQDFITEVENRFIEMLMIDGESGKWNVWSGVSSLTRYMLESGIPSQMIILILMLPIIATIIAFFRQVIGLTTFGVYTPTVLAISFIALGFIFGMAILFIILGTGAVMRKVLAHFRLLYIPKVSLILSILSVIIFMTLALGAAFNISAIASLAIFPMLIMMTLGEKFLLLQSEKGFFAAFLATAETIFVSLICYLVATWEVLQALSLNYPGWVFLGAILLNIGLGRFTGLRVKEYFRFREVFEAVEE